MSGRLGVTPIRHAKLDKHRLDEISLPTLVHISKARGFVNQFLAAVVCEMRIRSENKGCK